MNKPSDRFLIIARFALLEEPFQEYLLRKSKIKRVPEYLIDPAIDLWLYAEEYGIPLDKRLVDIFKLALKAQQQSRFDEIGRKNRAPKKRGRKPLYDKEYVVKFITDDFLASWKNYASKNKEIPKPTLSGAINKLQKDLQKEDPGFKVKPDTLRKIYYRHRTLPPDWLRNTDEDL